MTVGAALQIHYRTKLNQSAVQERNRTFLLQALSLGKTGRSENQVTIKLR